HPTSGRGTAGVLTRRRQSFHPVVRHVLVPGKRTARGPQLSTVPRARGPRFAAGSEAGAGAAGDAENATPPAFPVQHAARDLLLDPQGSRRRRRNGGAIERSAPHDARHDWHPGGPAPPGTGIPAALFGHSKDSLSGPSGSGAGHPRGHLGCESSEPSASTDRRKRYTARDRRP